MRRKQSTQGKQATPSITAAAAATIYPKPIQAAKSSHTGVSGPLVAGGPKQINPRRHDTQSIQTTKRRTSQGYSGSDDFMNASGLPEFDRWQYNTSMMILFIPWTLIKIELNMSFRIP
jgi:hypothetical protein